MPLLIDGSLRFVYSCSPTIVLRYDEPNKRMSEVVRKPMTDHANNFRGGSQLVEDDDGWLCLIHESVFKPDGDRLYIHRLVQFDSQLSIAGWSPPFVFLHQGIESCTGLARDGDRLLAAFGVDDREAWLASFDLAAARSLQPLAEAPNDVADGLGGRRATWELGELGVEPRPQIVDDRLAPALTCGAALTQPPGSGPA
jgi:hypothetical protein